MIYTGDLGLRAARRGHIPAAAVPPALRRRLAERPDSQVVYDAARRVAIGTGKVAAAAWEWVADAFRPDVPAAKAAAVRR